MQPTDPRGGAPGSPPGASARPTADPDATGGPSGLIGDSPVAARVERLLGLAPALILFAMMMLTFVNVVMRYVFRQPISGAFEVMSYLMGLLVFLSLVLVAVRAEHIRVSVLDGAVPRWLRRLRAVAFNLVMAAASAGLAWRFWLYGDRLAGWGEKTQMYGLPLGLLAQVMALSTAVCALVFVATALRAARDRDFLNRIEN